MSTEFTHEGRSVALYWDFENIHAGLCEMREPGSYSRGDLRFRPQEPLVKIQAVVDLAASFGPIAINRAYCNWQYFGRYRDQLLQNAVELIQLFPPGGAAKNGADIKLCLDATEDISRFPHIGTVIVVGGDSDFMPVSQKVKAAGRVLIGVGIRPTTNRHWAKSCHEFRYYETLVEVADDSRDDGIQPTTAHVVAASAAEKQADSPLSLQPPLVEVAPEAPRDLLRRAMRLLADKKKEPWINKAEIGPMIRRLDPTFDLAEHKFGSPPRQNSCRPDRAWILSSCSLKVVGGCGACGRRLARWATRMRCPRQAGRCAKRIVHKSTVCTPAPRRRPPLPAC